MAIDRTKGLNRQQIRELITRLDEEFEQEKLRKQVSEMEQKNEVRTTEN